MRNANTDINVLFPLQITFQRTKNGYENHFCVKSSFFVFLLQNPRGFLKPSLLRSLLPCLENHCFFTMCTYVIKQCWCLFRGLVRSLGCSYSMYSQWLYDWQQWQVVWIWGCPVQAKWVGLLLWQAQQASNDLIIGPKSSVQSQANKQHHRSILS